MLSWILWYLIIFVIGMAAWPFIAWLTPALKDKGYSLSKAAGLLLAGFSFWLLTNFRILQNNIGGVLFGVLIVLAISLWISRKDAALSWRSLWQGNKRLVIAIEAIFIVCFGLITLWRAANPAIAGTEKPMELAFINAILQSPGFPPQDPWLSGYSISYYYFGYILISMMIRLSGVVSGVGFTLTAGLIFAMTAVGIYGLVFNIINSDPVRVWMRRGKDHSTGTAGSSFFWPLLVPLFTLVISNVEGLLEFLHSRGLFWQRASDGTLISSFWKWLDIQELVMPPAEPFSWIPSRAGGILWWRASRVVSDYNLSNRWVEVIDEFPFFSFLLSDLHPHVLTLPFAVLALGLSLNLILGGATTRENKPGGWLFLSYPYWFFVPIFIGGLAFLNTWDFPIHLGILLLCYLALRVKTTGWNRERITEMLAVGIVLGVASITVYLAFFLGFKSQAGGIVPSMIFHTRGIHFWIMFGTLLIPLFGFLMTAHRATLPWRSLVQNLWKSGILVFGLWLLSYVLGFLGFGLLPMGNSLLSSTNPAISDLGYKLSELGFLFADSQGAQGSTGWMVLLESLSRRLQAPGTWLTLWICLSFVFSLIQVFVQNKKPTQEMGKLEKQAVSMNTLDSTYPPAVLFVLILVGAGALIVLVPEFIYLRDQFGTRMNTIFKFYYQGWLLWSIAAAVGVVVVFQKANGLLATVLRIGIGFSLAIGLLYPAIGIDATTRGVKISDLQLDGNHYLKLYQTDDELAMAWLRQSPSGVIAESVGGSYSAHARMSTHTGYPTIIGWTPHEGQWGRGPVEFGSRIEDVTTLYQTNIWEEAQVILDRYQVRYVVIGNLERSTYPVNELKFTNNLPVVYQNNSVTIYEYHGSSNVQIE